jgi:signal transduction histidine kinase
MTTAQGTFQEEGWRLRRDGTRFWADTVITAVKGPSGKLRGFVKITRDATERKQAEEALRQLSARLLTLQDEERRRLARELHDSTAQRLTALAAYLAVVEKSAGPLNRQARDALSECRSLAEECHREIRTLSYLLHPPMLDEIGLPDSLRWYCDGFTKRSKIPVELKIPSDLGRLPREVEGTLFRIVQESLTNIHRHSGSPRAKIRIDRNDNRLILEVRDEGRGMPMDMLSGDRINRARLGVGIAGMQERIRHLQGRLDIESGKGGTTIRTLIPITEGGI